MIVRILLSSTLGIRAKKIGQIPVAQLDQYADLIGLHTNNMTGQLDLPGEQVRYPVLIGQCVRFSTLRAFRCCLCHLL